MLLIYKDVYRILLKHAVFIIYLFVLCSVPVTLAKCLYQWQHLKNSNLFQTSWLTNQNILSRRISISFFLIKFPIFLLIFSNRNILTLLWCIAHAFI